MKKNVVRLRRDHQKSERVGNKEKGDLGRMLKQEGVECSAKVLRTGSEGVPKRSVGHPRLRCDF